MRGGQQMKPKLQIVKNLPRHNHRTQESSPINLGEVQPKISGSLELSIPQGTKSIERNAFGVSTKPIRSLRNSKEKMTDERSKKIPVLGMNFVRNSLAQHLKKEEILEYETGRRKKNFPITQRTTTEKNFRLTEMSEKEEKLITEFEKSVGKSKVKFRLGNKIKGGQRTEDLLEHLEQWAGKKESPSKNPELKKIFSLPKSERGIESKDNDEEEKKNALKYEKRLTEFEKDELSHYEMHYIGSRRIYSQSDFTDAEGDPKVLIHDSIAYRYEIVGQLGQGSFGRVFKALDHKKKEYVALKIIKSQKKFQEQAKVEISILQTALLKDPKLRCNVVKMKGSFVFRGHSCITFEILHKNLYEFLKEHQFAGFSQDLIRRFAIQILQALCFFKKNDIIHCDLKPENILLKEENKSGVRVIDVGSGCFEKKQIYTYIQSRFYRAPEVILGIKYTPAIDMWSFGCILVELFTGFPIFPGETENEQVMLFMEVFGEPPVEILEKAERRKKFFDDNFQCKIQQERGKERKISSVSLDEIIGSTDKTFTDLVRRCFEWNPSKRINPFEALMHEWILKGLPDQIRQQHIEQVQEEYRQ